MISRYIKSIGCEIECGIDENDYKKLKNFLRKNPDISRRFTLDYDGSVNVISKDFKSEEYTFYSEDLKEFFRVIKKLWSFNILQNSTCGNHLHVRINEDYLNAMLWQEFVAFFLNEYIKKFKKHKNSYKYLSRLESRYCRANYDNYVMDFLRKGGVSRYYAVNFLSLSERQETIEFRIFPYAEDFKEWKSMVLFLVKTIDKYFARGLEAKEKIIPKASIKIIKKSVIKEEVKVIKKSIVNEELLINRVEIN